MRDLSLIVFLALSEAALCMADQSGHQVCDLLRPFLPREAVSHLKCKLLMLRQCIVVVNGYNRAHTWRWDG